MWLICDLRQQTAELVAEQVSLVAANLELDALLIEDEALLVDSSDALDNLLDGFFAAWSVRLAGSVHQWLFKCWNRRQLFLNVADVVELNDTTALDGPAEASFEIAPFFATNTHKSSGVLSLPSSGVSDLRFTAVSVFGVSGF